VRVALDTNVLAYAEGVNTAAQQEAARALLRRLPRASLVLPVQVLGELFNVLVRKGGFSLAESRAAIKALLESVETTATSPDVIGRAVDLARDHQLSIWDAVILSAAAEAGCILLLSEDMHDGFAWNGVTVTNPFASDPHPLLERLLSARQ
jgi:predicted nucleic acid-binding protein